MASSETRSRYSDIGTMGGRCLGRGKLRARRRRAVFSFSVSLAIGVFEFDKSASEIEEDQLVFQRG